LCDPAEGVPLGIGTGVRKKRNDVATDGRKSFKIDLVI